ncbi:hypothetical protein ScPMuIL_018084 [Solemya velum]
MSSKEIVTLQIGHYSNFVGTHLWNIQDASFHYGPSVDSSSREINNDILFREGQNLMGHITYTPRLVAFDLRGCLNTLKQEGKLYEVTHEEEDIKWSGDVTMHKSVAPPKNRFLRDLDEQEAVQSQETIGNKIDSIEDVELKDSELMAVDENQSEAVFGSTTYYNLDDTITVWSDFIRLYLHPKSIYLMDKYTHGNEMEKFDIFGCGQQLMSDYATRTGVEDHLHYFVEDCDQLQGFQILLDTYDGFGGFGTQILQSLEDDYSSKGLLTMGVTPALLPDTTAYNRADRIINSALSYVSCAGSSSLFVPLSMAQELWKKMGPPRVFDHLQYNPTHYHTSAILAAALDNMTMPFRTTESPLHIWDITKTFSSLGRKLACLQLCLPFPLETDGNLVDSILNEGGQSSWRPLLPHMENKSSPLMQSVALRGIPKTQIKQVTLASKSKETPQFLSSCSNVDEVLQNYLTGFFPNCFNAGCVMSDGCKVGSPFPHIFSKNITKDGLLSRMNRHEYQGVESVPMLTSLQSTPDVTQMLRHLHKEASQLNIKKHHRFLEAGLEEDDYTETLSSLLALCKQYDHQSDL